MDRAESLTLDDPPGLVLRETMALPGCPHDQGFPPRIDKSDLRVVDEKAEYQPDGVCFLLDEARPS